MTGIGSGREGGSEAEVVRESETADADGEQEGKVVGCRGWGAERGVLDGIYIGEYVSSINTLSISSSIGSSIPGVVQRVGEGITRIGGKELIEERHNNPGAETGEAGSDEG